MQPRVVSRTLPLPPPDRQSATYDDLERHVITTATVFRVSGYLGRGKIYSRAFDTLREAVAHHAEAPCRCCVYAVNEHGRAVVVDKKDWSKWVEIVQ